MESAIRVYSIESDEFFSQHISATKIKSHSEARKLAPFLDEHKKPVYWVNWGTTKNNGKKRRAHFKHYPQTSNKSIKSIFQNEISERTALESESPKHKKAKEVIEKALSKLLKEGKHLEWSYSDSTISQFAIAGDLLAGAKEITKEFEISTPFDSNYKLDLAILGRVISNQKIVLAGIEVEFTNKFHFSKALVCKALGFPLISINIEKTVIENITEEWAHNILVENTKSNESGKRNNYLYIHQFLTSIYIKMPSQLFKEARHQYLIFCDNEEKLKNNLNHLKKILELNDSQVIISAVINKNPQLKVQIENAGKIAGKNWKNYSSNSYLQISIDKPIGQFGNLYYFHLIMAKLCNSVYNCVVGYKYEIGQSVSDEDDRPNWWTTRKIGNQIVKYKVAPFRLSEPIKEILEFYKSESS